MMKVGLIPKDEIRRTVLRVLPKRADAAVAVDEKSTERFTEPALAVTKCREMY